MADTGNPLERGPVVGTELKENIAEGYQKLGNVVQEPFKPGVTGDMVYQQAMDRGRAITALANGISEGFAPFVDKLASNYKDQNAEASTQSGLEAGLTAGANVVPGSPPSSPQTTPPGQPATAPTQTPTPTQAPGAPAAGQPDSGSQIARGADGLSTVLPSFPALFGGGLFGPDKNYTHAVGVGAAAKAGIDIDQGLNALRAKYAGDPEGFKNGSNAFLGNLQLSGVPNAGQIKIGGMKAASEYYNGLVTQKAAQDVKVAGATIGSQISSLSDDTKALLRNGATADTPEVAGKIAQIHTLYGQLDSNPPLAAGASIMPGTVAQELHQKDLEFQGTAMVGQVDKQFHANGAVAARAVVENWKQTSTLPDRERAQIAAQGDARIEFNTGQNADAVAQNKTAFEGLLKNPNAQQADFEAVRDNAARLSDTNTASMASAHIALAPMHPSTLGQTPAQADRADGVPPAGYRDNLGTGAGGSLGAPVGVGVGGLTAKASDHDAAAIKSIEGGNYGGLGPVTHTGDRAYGAYQVMGANVPSWTARYFGERLTPQEFLGNKAAQDAVFQGEFGRLKAKYGGTGAAQAWFAGEGGMHNTGATDSLGTSVGKYGAMYARFTGAGTPLEPAQKAPPPSANGVPFTPEQIRSNPYLLAESVRLTATDQKVRSQQFDLLNAAVNNSTKNNVQPPKEALTELAQLGSSLPEKDAEFQKTAAAVTIFEGTKADIGAGGGGGAIGGLIDQAKQDATRSPDIWQQQVALGRKDQLDRWAKQMKDDPATFSMNAGYTSRMPRPIDYNNPATIAPGLAERAQVQNGIASRQGGETGSAILPADMSAAQAVMAGGPPQSAKALLEGVAALPGPVRDATIADKDFSASVLGMAKSGDPTKMEAAHSLMDQVWRANPMTFESKFGKDALSDLRAWQYVEQFKSPDQIAKDAMTANDPNVVRAREGLKNQADDLLKPVTGKTIIDGMAGPVARWNPFGTDYSPISDAPAAALGSLREDYADAYRNQFSKTADSNAADKYAKEIVATKWTFSQANGGRLTAFAPETSPAYPQVNGSKDYIGTQLSEFMVNTGHPGARGYLVPDGNTEAEIKSGKPPSYRVVAQGNDGQYHALPTSTRFSADPRAAQRRANEDFETANRPTWQGP